MRAPTVRQVRVAIIAVAVLAAGGALWAIHPCALWVVVALTASWAIRRIWSERTRNQGLWEKGDPS